MNEPEYRYVKGQGWVPGTYETLTRVMGNYVVTLTRRPPQTNERYYKEPTGRPLEISMDNISQYPGPEQHPIWTLEGTPIDHYGQYIVVTVKEI